jgi:hypothetical protein
MMTLKIAAMTALARRRIPVLAGRSMPTVPRTGAAITAHRKIRKPSRTRTDAVMSNSAKNSADSTAMNPAPIRSIPLVP